jgi:hypothetical protein
VRLLADYAWPWLGPAGLAALAWAARARAWPGALRAALAGALVANVAYALDYGVPDPAPYFLAPLALALAIAPAAALAWAPLRRAARPAAGVAAAALAVAAVLWVGTGRERARTYARFDALLHAMWTSIPYPRGFVVWSDDMAPHLREYQLFAGEKPGLEVLHPLELTHPWPRREFMARHGFDPVSDAAIRARAERERPHNVQELSHTLVGAILTQINARSPLPVVEFLPEVPSVRLLVKAGAADSAGAARAGDAAGAAGAGR